MQITIQIRTGPTRGCRLTIDQGDAKSFGRTQSSDFVFHQDLSMSSRHFQISNDSTGFIIEDLQSTNGTSVNGNFVTKAVLQKGDSIVAGTTGFTIEEIPESLDTPVSEAPLNASLTVGEPTPSLGSASAPITAAPHRVDASPAYPPVPGPVTNPPIHVNRSVIQCETVDGVS